MDEHLVFLLCYERMLTPNVQIQQAYRVRTASRRVNNIPPLSPTQQKRTEKTPSGGEMMDRNCSVVGASQRWTEIGEHSGSVGRMDEGMDGDGKTGWTDGQTQTRPSSD